MKRFAGFLVVAFLALYTSAANAQCNTASGFLQTKGEIALGNLLILGPDCNHAQDGGAPPLSGGIVYASQCGILFDGVTDDTVAWNNCISTYAQAKSIIAPCGISIINSGNVTLSIPSNAIIIGQGPYCTVLRSAGTTADIFKLSGATVSGCKISNLTIDQKAGVVRTAGAGINAENNNVNGCEFSRLIINGAFDGVVLGPANYAWTSYLQVFNAKRYGISFKNGPGVGGGVSLQWKIDHALIQGSASDAIRVQATAGPTGPISVENWNSIYTFNNGGYGINIQCVATLTCFGIRIADSFFGNDGLGSVNISSWNGGHTIDHTYFEQTVSGACLIVDNTNIDMAVNNSFFLQCAGFAIDSAPTVNFTSNGNRFQSNNVAAGTGTSRAANCTTNRFLYPPSNFRISGTGPEVNCTTGLLKTFVFASGDTATIGSWALLSVPSSTIVFNNSMTLGSVASATLSFQGTDTYVGRTTTDTLTNKSIDAGQLTGTIVAGRMPAYTGDCTTIAGAVATTCTKINGVDQTAAWSTYTPTISSTGGTLAATGTTMATVSGRYRVIGKTIVTQCAATVTVVGTASGTWFCTLPVTASGLDTYTGSSVEVSITGRSGGASIAAGTPTLVSTRQADTTTYWTVNYRVVITITYESS